MELDASKKVKIIISCCKKFYYQVFQCLSWLEWGGVGFSIGKPIIIGGQVHHLLWGKGYLITKDEFSSRCNQRLYEEPDSNSCVFIAHSKLMRGLHC